MFEMYILQYWKPILIPGEVKSAFFHYKIYFETCSTLFLTTKIVKSVISFFLGRISLFRKTTIYSAFWWQMERIFGAKKLNIVGK